MRRCRRNHVLYALHMHPHFAYALQFLHKLAPPSAPYLHNDLHYREAPEGWPGGWEAWCGGA